MSVILYPKNLLHTLSLTLTQMSCEFALFTLSLYLLCDYLTSSQQSWFILKEGGRADLVCGRVESRDGSVPNGGWVFLSLTSMSLTESEI